MIKKRLYNFFEKIGVKQLGLETISKLYDNGLESIIEILDASPDDYGIGDKVSKKIHDNMHKIMKKVSKSKIISGAGLLGQGIGERKIDTLLDEIPDFFDENTNYTKTDLLKIKGFADKTVTLIIENSKSAKDLLQSLKKYRDDSPKKSKLIKNTDTNSNVNTNVNANVELVDKKILFSGFRDKELEPVLKDIGAKVVTSISKNTDILIIKDESQTSSKVEKAKELGVKIMTIEEFKRQYKV
jgi:NAD-dependent DNA ligase